MAISCDQSGPNHNADVPAEQDMAEQWTADSQLHCDSAAQVTGQQDRAEQCRFWHGIENCANEQENSQDAGQTVGARKTKTLHRFNHR